MSRRKVSTTIYITPEQADRLKLLHDRTKVPIAIYIREGIDMVLKHYAHMMPGQMSLGPIEPGAAGKEATSGQPAAPGAGVGADVVATTAPAAATPPAAAPPVQPPPSPPSTTGVDRRR